MIKQCWVMYPTFLIALLVLPFNVYSKQTENGITVILNSALPNENRGNVTNAKKKMVDIIRRLVHNKETPQLAIHGVHEENANTVMAAMCRALVAERAVIVGSLPNSVTNLVASMSGAFDLPYITWDKGSGSINILPPNCQVFSVQPEITQPLLDFLSSWGWKQFAYLYGSEDAFQRLQFVLHKIFSDELQLGRTTGEFVSPWQQKIKSQHPRSLPRITNGYINVEDPDTIHKSLRAIDTYLSTQVERNVIIDLGEFPVDVSRTGSERLDTLFKWLARMGMMRSEYNYLIVDYNLFELNLHAYQKSGVNITGFHLLDYEDPLIKQFSDEWHDVSLPLHDVAFMMDGLELARKLKQATISMKETAPTVDEKEEKPKCYTNRGVLVSKETSLKWRYGVQSAQWMLNNEVIGQTGIIRFDAGSCKRTGYRLILSSAFGDHKTRTIAKWSNHSGWVLPSDSKNPSFFLRRHTSNLKEKIQEPLNYNNILEIFRLKNHTLRVVTVLSKPFIMHGSNVPTTVKSGRQNFVGYCRDLADHIFAHLDLNYEIHLVKDGMFGTIDPATKEWNGMVGEILRDEADLIIAPLTMNIIRAKYVDFTEPFMNFGLSVMLRKPGKTKPGMFSFLSPLTNQVWLCTAGATLFVGVGLCIIAAISPKEQTHPDQNLGFNLGNSIWFSVASFVHQGIDIFPLSPGARVFASIWRYFCLVIMAYYTANLAAALSVERLITPVNSIKDFAERPDLPIKIGTLDSGSTKDFFSTSTDPIYKTIFKNMMKEPSVFMPTMQAGFDKVRTAPYAFVVESKMIEFVNHRRPCNTMMVGNTFGSKAYAVGLPSTKPDMRIFKEHITDAILRLRENQVLAKLYKEWWIEKGECLEGSQGSTSEPLALVNLSGVFYILIAGMVLAVATGVAIFVYQLKKANRIGQGYQSVVQRSISQDTSF